MNKAYAVLFKEEKTKSEVTSNGKKKKKATKELSIEDTARIARIKRDRNLKEIQGPNATEFMIDKVQLLVMRYSPPGKFFELFDKHPDNPPIESEVEKEIKDAFAAANDKYKYFAKEGYSEYEKFKKMYQAFKFRQISEPELTDDSSKKQRIKEWFFSMIT